MHTSVIKSVAVGALFSASMAFGAVVEKNDPLAVLPEAASPHATCKCKGQSDCTCPKGQCKCKSCGHGVKRVIIESLKGAQENTQLPDTARSDDARGGVLI